MKYSALVLVAGLIGGALSLEAKETSIGVYGPISVDESGGFQKSFVQGVHFAGTYTPLLKIEFLGGAPFSEVWEPGVIEVGRDGPPPLSVARLSYHIAGRGYLIEFEPLVSVVLDHGTVVVDPSERFLAARAEENEKQAGGPPINSDLFFVRTPGSPRLSPAREVTYDGQRVFIPIAPEPIDPDSHDPVEGFYVAAHERGRVVQLEDGESPPQVVGQLMHSEEVRGLTVYRARGPQLSAFQSALHQGVRIANISTRGALRNLFPLHYRDLSGTARRVRDALVHRHFALKTRVREIIRLAKERVRRSGRLRMQVADWRLFEAFVWVTAGKLAEKVAEKKSEDYPDVYHFLRGRLELIEREKDGGKFLDNEESLMRLSLILRLALYPAIDPSDQTNSPVGAWRPAAIRRMDQREQVALAEFRMSDDDPTPSDYWRDPERLSHDLIVNAIRSLGDGGCQSSLEYSPAQRFFR